MLANLFDKAEVVPHWAHDDESENASASASASASARAIEAATIWDDAPWSEYSSQQSTRKESRTGGVQDVWNQKFMNTHNSTLWNITDTHIKYFEKLTQDCLMHLADRDLSCTHTGLAIELVGQDEPDFPSKAHKSKFIRDLIRLHKKRGYVGCIYGVITDLSRITSFRLQGDASRPQFHRTVVERGAMVKKRMVAFLNATPEQLGMYCMSG
jgi:hypothetical protein